MHHKKLILGLFVLSTLPFASIPLHAEDSKTVVIESPVNTEAVQEEVNNVLAETTDAAEETALPVAVDSTAVPKTPEAVTNEVTAIATTTAEATTTAAEDAVAKTEDVAAAVADAVTAEAPKAEAPKIEEVGPRPDVKISQRGAEFQIEVRYDHPMDRAKNDYLESIQMESPTGEFLGMKSFNEKEKDPLAIFMVNPSLYSHSDVVFVTKSSSNGIFKSIVKLEITKEEPKPEVAAEAVTAAADTAPEMKQELENKVDEAEKAVEAPKKKKWLW